MTTATDNPMTLEQKAKEMRDALDGIELALCGIDGLDRARRLWDDADVDVTIKLEMSAATLRQLGRAFDECNRIMNSPEFIPALLEA